MKLLINHPDMAFIGGVANHYQGLLNYWRCDVLYNTVGRRKSFPRLTYIFLLWDIIKFVYKLFVYRPNVVILNPSLGVNALKRDFFFLRIVKMFGFCPVVFFHGFDLDYAKEINREWICKHLNRTALIFVLANSFKQILLSWGVTVPIELTTTKVDNGLIPLKPAKREEEEKKVTRLLFLARIDKSKGIYEAIDAFSILASKYPELTLSIVGDGPELASVRSYVKELPFCQRINIFGSLVKVALQQAYMQAQLYILPSYHAEGMPTSVLEAMAFGLPVFTRKVGGLVDFFDEKMGYITDSLNPEDFATAMEVYLNDFSLYQRVSDYNQQYAQANFMASQVALDIEHKIKKHIRINNR